MVVLVIAVSDAEALSGMILAAQPRQPVRPPAISCFSLTFSVCQKSGIEYLWTALKLKAGVPGSFKLEFALLSKLFLY